MSDAAARAPEFRVLPMSAIDPPPRPSRESMDDVKLLELSASIKERGLIQPIGVYERDGRFVIIYGHRRYCASELAREQTIACRIHPDGNAREEELKFAENYLREDLNPMEEATYFADLLEDKYDGAIEGLAAALHLKVSFIDGRLELLRGDERVQEALRAGKINLAVARELIKIKHPHYLAVILEDAIREGHTSSEVMRRRLDIDRTLKMQEIGADPALVNLAPSREASIESVDACLLCESTEDPLAMIRVAVHKDCLTSLMRRKRTTAAAEA